MNLLPVPRHVDLEVHTVVAREPRVALGVTGIPAEGYRIRIANDGAVTIDAADPAGAFYAGATLVQLERLHDGKVPVGTIFAPSFTPLMVPS